MKKPNIPPPIEWIPILGNPNTTDPREVAKIRTPLFEFIRDEYGIVFDESTPLAPPIYETFIDKEYTIYPEFYPFLGDVVVDAGAQFGDYTLLCARAGAKEVHAFEPHPDCYTTLEKNMRLNSFNGKAVLYNAALGSECAYGAFAASATTMYYLCDGRTVEPILKQHPISEDEAVGHMDGVRERIIATRVLSLDSLKIPATLIKMDVEGYELHVLHGAKETIEYNQPRIVIETHSDKLAEDCTDFLENLGYKLKHVSDPHPIFFFAADPW
jgi:FkbM family methyltransferase